MTTRCAPKELQGRQKRVRRHPEPLVEHGEGDFKRASVPRVSLEPARRATPEHLPHQDSEIEAARVDQQSFEGVPMPRQVRAAHPAGVVHVSEGPFDILSASTQEPLTAHPAHAPSITIDGTLRFRRRRPVSAATLGLGDVRPHADRVQIDHRLVAVISLVSDKLGERRRRGARGVDGLDLFGGGDRRLAETGRVADVRALQGHGDHRAAVEIDGVLGFVREVRAAVLLLRDLRLGSDGVLPFFVRRPLRPPRTGPRQCPARRRPVAGLRREPLARLDRRRTKRTSNKDWKNPFDPDAKITKMKDGRTHLAHKAEHAIDLDSGAMVAVTLQGADVGDTTSLGETAIAAAEQVEAVHTASPTPAALTELIADKGYHSNQTMIDLHAVGVRSYIAEPERGRRHWTTAPEAQRAVYGNRRRVSGVRGKRLLRRRGEYVERSFAHVYDTGGMRRPHLRGHRDILQRLLIHASALNLGILMRQGFGGCTPRGLQGHQWGAPSLLIPPSILHGRLLVATD